MDGGKQPIGLNTVTKAKKGLPMNIGGKKSNRRKTNRRPTMAKTYSGCGPQKKRRKKTVQPTVEVG